MIITPEATQHTPTVMIDFYKKHFAVIHAVTCKVCKNTLAIELSHPLTNDVLGLKPHPNGIFVLPIDDKLMASRIRLDGMMGYQCGALLQNPEYEPARKVYEKDLAAYETEYKQLREKAKAKTIDLPPYQPPRLLVPEMIRCGNDTRSFYIEEELSPAGDFLPHQVAAIREKMQTSEWKAPISVKDGREHRGSFVAERV